MTTFENRLKDMLSHAYDIERELGGGGMSRVFVATDRSLGRKVVIKLLSPELTADVNKGRFRREIQVAAQLQHPHIVPLLSAGEHEDLLYFTMPFIQGESLKSAIDKKGPLSIEDAVRVIYHVGEALDYAHGAGVVHRDIKPANILRSGTYALVTDFGVAKALDAAMASSSAMTQTGMAIGTPAYMAPEQLAGDSSADHRIDIYALGLLAYELLNGRSPFAGATPQRILAAVLTQTPPPLIDVRPDVPQSLSSIVMSCLSKEPAERPASARQVLGSLDTFATASGEIRTMEYRVSRGKRIPTDVSSRSTPAEVSPIATPPEASSTPTPAEPAPIVGGSPADEVAAVEDIQADGYDRPKKSRKKLVAGVIALLVPAAAVAIFMSQRAGDGSSTIVAPSDTAAAAVGAVTDSAVVQTPQPAVTDSAASAAPVVSKAAADSVRRAARAEAAKKAVARTDSVRRVRETSTAGARRAAAALVANQNAWRSFTRGATGRGGPLGARRRGDLQTQIDALQPFLTSAGLTYEQFKGVVAESGIKLFDEFGRMVPDSLQRFAGG